jgi:hypothetical protein
VRNFPALGTRTYTNPCMVPRMFGRRRGLIVVPVTDERALRFATHRLGDG